MSYNTGWVDDNEVPICSDDFIVVDGVKYVVVLENDFRLMTDDNCTVDMDAVMNVAETVLLLPQF